MAKTIQIAFDTAEIVALCDDGSIWHRSLFGNADWVELPPVPETTMAATPAVPGPAGPQGEPGEQGEQGERGPKGDPGKRSK